MTGRSVKVCVIAGLLLQVAAVLLISSKEVTGYEIGIYQNVPVEAWALLAASALIAFYILYRALSRGEGLGYFALLIMGVSVVFLALPMIKGYVFYGNYDPLTHLGIVKDILSQGFLCPDKNSAAGDDFYPIVHILVGALSILSGMDPAILAKLLLFFTYLLFVLFMLVWCRELLILNNASRTAYAMISLAISAIFILKAGAYTTLVPSGFSIVLVPLLFYLYIKRSMVHKWLLFVCLLIIPFCHPLNAIILLVAFIAYELSKKLYNWLAGVHENISINHIFALLASFLLWASSYSIFGYKVIATWVLIQMWSMSSLSMINDAFSRINMTLEDRIVWILKVYGPNIVLGLLALLAVVVIFREVWKRALRPEHGVLFPLGIMFTVLGTILFAVVVIGDPGIEAIRNYNFVFLFSIPLATYIILKICSYVKSRWYALLAVLVLLAGVPYLVSLFSLYDSPYVNYPGGHVTNAQLDGMDWFFTNKDLNSSGAKLSAAAPWRYSDFLYGVKIKNIRTDIGYYYDTRNWIDAPDHFADLQENIPGRYLLYNMMDYLTYTEVWRIRYDPDDFARLDDYRGVAKIYANGDLVVRYVA